MQEAHILQLFADQEKIKAFLRDYTEENDPKNFQSFLTAMILKRLLCKWVPGFSRLFKKELEKFLNELKPGPAVINKSEGNGKATQKELGLIKEKLRNSGLTL